MSIAVSTQITNIRMSEMSNFQVKSSQLPVTNTEVLSHCMVDCVHTVLLSSCYSDSIHGIELMFQCV